MIQTSHAAGDCTFQSGCAALCVSESGYYDWLHRQAQGLSVRERQDAELTHQIAVLHAESGKAYGSPRMHAALKAPGIRCSKHRVARLMRQSGIRSRRAGKPRRIQTTDSNHKFAVATNLLARQFGATAPDQKWVADTTYIATQEGWCFLAVVLDLFSRKVVGWACAPHFTNALVCQALRNALVVRKPPELLHTDRGVQYASVDHQALLAGAKIRCSMSRLGDPYDNAVVESFFASLKSECDMARDGFANPEHARRTLFAYIEGFYNRRRLHSALAYQSPEAFEQSAATALGKAFA